MIQRVAIMIKAIGFDFFRTLVYAKADESVCINGIYNVLFTHKINIIARDTCITKYCQIFIKVKKTAFINKNCL